VIGNLIPDRSIIAGTQVTSGTASYTQTATPSIGALVSFHQQLHPWLGYRVTATYSQPTFEYTYAASPNINVRNIVNERLYELSGSYVVQGPRHRRITPSAEAGAGLLAFQPVSPNQSSQPVSHAERPVALVGVAAEFILTKHLSLHAEYRVLLFTAPGSYFAYGSDIPTPPGNIVVSSNPSIGITYHFRPTREQ
jgi:hypothetical protein